MGLDRMMGYDDDDYSPIPVRRRAEVKSHWPCPFCEASIFAYSDSLLGHAIASHPGEISMREGDSVTMTSIKQSIMDKSAMKRSAVRYTQIQITKSPWFDMEV